MKINSVFKSINGEINRFHQGSICTFIRLQGCSLKCSYCDTLYSRDPEQGQEMTIEEVVSAVKDLKCKTITITGGEPLMQMDELLKLTNALFRHGGYKISIETNGSFLIPFDLFQGVYWVIDYKGPSSGCENKMLMENFLWSRAIDIVKFVIKDDEDFNKACDVIDAIQRNRVYSMTPIFAFSPMFAYREADYSPAVLVDKLKQKEGYENLQITVNLQLHKIINVD